MLFNIGELTQIHPGYGNELEFESVLPLFPTCLGVQKMEILVVSVIQFLIASEVKCALKTGINDISRKTGMVMTEVNVYGNECSTGNWDEEGKEWHELES